MAKDSKKLNREPYKGVKDFYPRDKFLQNYIFGKWEEVAKAFGYEEINSSILEPTNLYEAKTGEEIVSEQTYSFTDRGERSVTLRPEMTPSVARMVARRKRDLNFPLRWFSIANFFRYERPQRGRSREFYQLNCDLFGVDGVDADLEIINLAYSVMKEFGAKDEDFQIRINDRNLIDEIFTNLGGVSKSTKVETLRLLDKKDKIDNFDSELERNLGLELKKKFMAALESIDTTPRLDELKQKLNLPNVVIDTKLARGFDYYTGLVFEIWDTGSENNRSLFGGGRYDNLMEIFGEESIPTIGFAVGDVTMENYLESYNLLPEYKSETDLMICTLDSEFIKDANKLAGKLRGAGLNVVVNLTNKKVGDQVSSANKKNIPFILCIGEEEVESGKYKIKNLQTGKEELLETKEIYSFIKASC